MRAAIFIDGGYLIKQLQDARLTPDYRNLAAYLLKPLRRNVQLDLMRCYFYYCPPWMSDRPTEAELRRMAAHERFMAELQEQCDRWQVRLGKLERRREGDKEVFAQKRVDVQLSVDMVQHAAAGHIQHAVLVAGDSDFIPAVIATKQSGATLTLWCDKDRSVHRDLMLHADEVHYFDWRHFPGRRVQLAPQIESSAAPATVTEEPVTAPTLETQVVPEVSQEPSDHQPAVQAESGARPQGGGRSRRRRGRRRGGPKTVDGSQRVDEQGQSNDGSTAVETELVATSPEPAVPESTSPEPAEPVAAVPEPASPEHVATEGAAPEAAPAGPNSPRRRGGRGRRRKNSPGTPPVAE